MTLRPISAGFRRRRTGGFTLIEMLIVVAIIAILMTAGAVSLNNIGGKNVTSAVASAEAMFDQARTVAIGRGTTARVVIAKSLDNVPTENLRRIMVVYRDPGSTTEKWILANRAITLPDQVYFSKKFSYKNQKSGSGTIDDFKLDLGKPNFAGTYYYYEFNAEGICAIPGAGFVVGSGARRASVPTDSPRVTANGTSDFGGFVIWRNGRTSMLRSPAQATSAIKSLKSGDQF